MKNTGNSERFGFRLQGMRELICAGGSPPTEVKGWQQSETATAREIINPNYETHHFSFFERQSGRLSEMAGPFL
jgi:hypothetical protein